MALRTSPDDQPALHKILTAQGEEAHDGFSLIASECVPMPLVVAAYRDAQDMGFGGNYAEGYPPKDGEELGSGRYYRGVDQADILEQYTIDQVKNVLMRGVKNAGANVQVPSGAYANQAVYRALLYRDEAILAPSLKAGYGHLSHGADSPSFVGEDYRVIPYGVNMETEEIDYNRLAELAMEHEPMLIVAGASSYPLDIKYKRIAEIAKPIGAVTMADISHPAGPTSVELLTYPAKCGINVVTTTTHKTLMGMKGAVIAWDEDAIGEWADSHHREVDVNFTVFPKLQGGPDLPTMAAHAALFTHAQTESFRRIQGQILKNNKAFADRLKELGWPLIAGGTENHLVLADVTKVEGLDAEAGKDGLNASIALEKVGLITNKNARPGSKRIKRPHAIRMGSTSYTGRGGKEELAVELADLVDRTLRVGEDLSAIDEIRQRVFHLAHDFPYPTYT